MKDKTYRYVLIDDEPVFNTIHAKLISIIDQGAEVQSFNVSVEALESLMQTINNGTLPDVIFLDINMPEKNGFEVLEALAAIDSEALSAVRFYMLTSSLDERDRSRAMSFPFVSGFYSKPLTKNLLEELIS